jgi:hypothetical protein
LYNFNRQLLLLFTKTCLLAQLIKDRRMKRGNSFFM